MWVVFLASVLGQRWGPTFSASLFLLTACLLLGEVAGSPQAAIVGSPCPLELLHSNAVQILP